MADPRETWQKLQNALQEKGRAGFGGGFPGGGGGRALGGASALFIAGVGIYVGINSLFNGV